MNNDILSDKDRRAVEDILIDILGVKREQLTPESHLMEDLGADSLELVEIIMALEERFNIAVPDERAGGVATVGNVFETLAENLPRPRSA